MLGGMEKISSTFSGLKISLTLMSVSAVGNVSGKIAYKGESSEGLRALFLNIMAVLELG